MKINTTILELSQNEAELLNEEYTKAIVKIIASELSIQDINELIEKLMIS